MSGKSLEALELEQEESIRFQNCSLFPSLSWKCKSNIGIDNLIEVITNKFYSSTHRGPSELCGNVFKIEYTKDNVLHIYAFIVSTTFIRLEYQKRKNKSYRNVYFNKW